MSENKTKAQQLQELQEAQLAGNAEMIPANKSDKHEIAAAEKDYLHVELVTRTNNPATQTYDDSSRVVAFRPEEYESMKKTGSFDGYYSQTIVHDPRKAAEVKASDKRIETEAFVSSEPNIEGVGTETAAPAATTTTAKAAPATAKK